MKFREIVLLLVAAVLVIAGYFGARILLHGFTTATEPSRLDTIVARAARNFAIPRKARLEPSSDCAPLNISESISRPFLCTLTVTQQIEQESLNVSLQPEVKFLRARWELNRWRRGSPTSMFLVGLEPA